ncbi:uncharacterized protein LOC107981466 [Nasonia vitripennis]|uniref:Uncharacterized protein n=1 Tax=Nasonia vitripennis TaxID=7425 RepID=A0A7M7IS74_NASVI|nr:uncharacterized protein LOC107981466 [Nasonia vitripennis]
MPRCTATSVEQIFEILQKKIVFNKNGSIVKKSDKLWKEASSSIKNVVCGTTLYFYVAKDWNGLATKLKEYYRQNENPECAASVKKDSKIIDDCPKLVFTIIFDRTEWLGLQPILKEEKKILPEGWTHLIMKKIWMSQQIPCPYSFKKGYVSSKNNTIKFHGSCKECGNSISGICNISTAENQTFHINT